MKWELSSPASGDDEEGCNAGSCHSRSTAFFSPPVVPTVFSSFDFSILEMKKLRR
jgi:hypothetical protein